MALGHIGCREWQILQSLFYQESKMKSDNVPEPGVVPSSGGDKSPAKPSDLGLTERRHGVRPLPVPDVLESDGDTDWATFQALVSDQPKE
jgi:hypothetical protein